jgi:putative nucleotidyltransferase with HDIG domain
MTQMQTKHFRILAADDDDAILDLYQRILCPDRSYEPNDEPEKSQLDTSFRIPKFEVSCCTQGDEAVAFVQRAIEEHKPYAVVFLDLNMPPGPDGEWAAEQILTLDPNTNIVLVTGYFSTSQGHNQESSDSSDRILYLQKPFHRQEIMQFAVALSTKWQAEQQLLSLHSDLEMVVEQRTAELRKSNEKLRIEVESRKRIQHELQRSFENLKKVMNGTIQAIALTVEKRDPYTSGHQQRVAQLARATAAELGMSAEQIESVYMAAAIHDIGKISLPAEILSKPGTLSDIEVSLIQAHSQAGFDILKEVEFPWNIAEIVLQHHERMDGSGYPNGISADDILFETRIVSVADVVETMASHRPYRPSIGIDKALEEITQNKGKLYDPRVVDACLVLLTQKGFEFTK